MTTDRDFDRIATAWLDLMPDRVPDRVVEDILEDVALTPQARRPLVRLPWTPPQSHRLMLIAATVLIGAALLGGALLLAGSQPATPLPTPAAPPSVGPSPTTAASELGGGLAPSLEGTWLADAPVDLSFGDPSGPARLSWVVDTNGSATYLIASPGGPEHFSAHLTSPAANTLVVDAKTGGDAVSLAGTPLRPCEPNEQGTYQPTRSPDGLLLALVAIDDPCTSRATVLARTWVRSLGSVSSGGLGVVDAFDPLFTVEIPNGSYTADRTVPDAMTIAQGIPEFAFLAFKDPQGFLDPCDPSAGRYEIAPGAGAVVAYFRQLKGFMVNSVTERAVDGHRAVHLVVHANVDAKCPGRGLAEWQPKAARTNVNWFLRPGDTDSLVLVELADATLMFQVLSPLPGVEDAVINSIRFLDLLPTSP